MEKKRVVFLTIVIFFVALIVTAGSYAFWSWTSTNNKSIVFNTASNLKNYIKYNEGESAFTGELTASNNYQTGSIHSTISIYKTTDINLLATIHMDINAIGNEMKKSPALKWVVTEGTTSNVGNVLAKGNFIGTNAGDTLTLVPDLVVNTTETFYTIWIWLDSSENPSTNLSGETLDTNVWTEINQAEGAEDRYEITRISANYQKISATVVDSKYNVTSYAVTQSSTTPTSWTTITPATDQGHVYNLNTNVSSAGTYYVWFKDSNNRTTSKPVTVDSVDTTGPVCTWGTFNPTTIQNNETSQINLTCIDEESEITVHKLTTSDITVSNNKVNVTNISKSTVTNGYKYVVTVTGTNNDGTSTLTLTSNLVKNAMGYGNESSTTPNNITVTNVVTVTVTPPTVVSRTRTYTANAQELLDTAGNCSTGGTMYWYSSNPGTSNSAPTFSTSTWTTTTPTTYKGTNAGTYYIWYYCKVDDMNHYTGNNINTVKSVTKE